jgi:DNA-directed RNA polymerase specialized sigma24 family protein
MESTKGKARELTPEDFTKFLAILDSDGKIAGEKYEELRGQLIKFFEWRGSLFPDELADETLNRLTRKIAEGEEIEKNIIALALGIARFVLLESLKHPGNRRAEMEEAAPLTAPPDHRAEDDDLWVVCLRECLRSVSVQNRELIIEYYQEEGRAKIDDRKKLADRLGISLNALFSRARRIRDKLEVCVTRCVKRKSI